MSVLAQITSWRLDRIIEGFASKHKIQNPSFSAISYVLAMVYYYFAHALSLNDTCDSLSKCSMKLWNKAKVHQEERRVMVDERIRLKGINTKGALFNCALKSCVL